MRKIVFLSMGLCFLIAMIIFVPVGQSRHVPPTAERLASQCWLMDEMTGTVTKDSCGSNDGTKHANVVLQSSGIFGFSYAFDNTQTTTPISIAHFTTPNQFTLESWFFPLSLATTGDPNRVMFKPQYYNLQMGGSGLCRFEVFIGAAYSALGCSTFPTLNVWNHVVGTYDGAMMKIYMNGVLVNSKSQTGAVGDGSSTTLTIGGGPGAPFTVTNFHGRIDVTRKFGYALTAQEVREYYQQHDWEKASQEQVWLAQSGSTVSTGAVATTTVFVPQERDKEPLVSAFSIWEISGTFTASAQPAEATQTFQFQADGTNIAGCTWSITRGAIALGLVVINEGNYLARCPHPFYVEPGSHTLAVVIGGTTIVEGSRTDFMLLQETSHMGYDSYYGPINYDLEIARSNQTNGYVNTTAATTQNTILVQHQQTRTLINTTSQLIIDNQTVQFVELRNLILGINITDNITVNVTDLEESLLFVLLQAMNPIAEAIDNSVFVFATLIILISLIIWAEWVRDQWVLYLLATVASITLTIFLWEDLIAFRYVVIAAGAYCILMTILTAQEQKGRLAKEDEE